MRVGPDYAPCGSAQRKVIYRRDGPITELRDQTAIAMVWPDGETYSCQFDRTSTGYGFGWWKIPKEHLILLPEMTKTERMVTL